MKKRELRNFLCGSLFFYEKKKAYLSEFIITKNLPNSCIFAILKLEILEKIEYISVKMKYADIS